MQIVLSAAAVYLFLLVIFRLSGRRTLGQMTAFDFVLVLIISETTQQALTGTDYSLTRCFLVVLTLIALDNLLGHLKRKSPAVDRWLDGCPMILVKDGRLLEDRCRMMLVDEHDVLAAARVQEGISDLDRIHLAVLETDGKISVIPRK